MLVGIGIRSHFHLKLFLTPNYVFKIWFDRTSHDNISVEISFSIVVAPDHAVRMLLLQICDK
jgi:hypothetical protein